MMLSGAFCFHSEHSYACKELYEVPGGDQVDGSPPAPVHISRFDNSFELKNYSREL